MITRLVSQKMRQLGAIALETPGSRRSRRAIWNASRSVPRVPEDDVAAFHAFYGGEVRVNLARTDLRVSEGD